MSKQIRGAVIGYGGAFNMGKAHAEHMQRVGFEFVAVLPRFAGPVFRFDQLGS